MAVTENLYDVLVLAVALATWYGENMPRTTDVDLARRVAGYLLTTDAYLSTAMPYYLQPSRKLHISSHDR